MHEGLLIIDKSEKSAIFCNRTARNLISTFLGPLTKDTTMNFKKQAFMPIKILSKKVSNSKFEKMIENDN